MTHHDDIEARSIENPSVPVSAAAFVDFFGGFGGMEASGVVVNAETALGVPAFWAAVNFMAGTIAGLPLHTYRRDGDSRRKLAGGIATVVHDAPNDEQSSFEFRKFLFDQVLTTGRGLAFIERAPNGRVLNLWPLETRAVQVERIGGRKRYHYQDGARRVTYAASEVIDIPWMLKPDGLQCYSPVERNKQAIGRAIAAQLYAGRAFENGGVPPFALVGPFQSSQAMQRASDDLESAVKQTAKDKRQALVLPSGHELHKLGVTPEEMQLLDAQRFSVEEIARIFSLPPTFLQDLTHGTFSNTEQQDLHFVKHTLKRWLEQFEQEMNLKLFGRTSNRTYVEFDVDGLLRGDFETRMNGYGTAIQHGVLTPNEARRAENRPDMDGGDGLMVQGAMIPLSQAGVEQSNDPNGGADHGA
jgi:HK97 family phage portal protein